MSSSIAPWQTLARHSLFAAGPIQEVAVERVQLPSGREVDDYYQIRLPDYVLIFPVMDDGTVAMQRQYKHGARRVCLTFPGGGIEAGETPLSAAQRELREELGCVAAAWEPLASLVTNANQRCNTAHLFFATDCRRIEEPQSGDLEEVRLEFFDAHAMREPGMTEAIGLASHVALLLLGMQRVR